MDENGHNLLFGIDTNDNSDKDDETIQNDDDQFTSSSENENSSSEENENSEKQDKEYETKDPIRKHQFDHNRNTCMTNNYPEMFLDKNGERVTTNAELSFAPAEGNYPVNILNETDWDIKSWPALHPDGKFGLHYKRKVKLTDQQYFGQRILNKDLRYCKSPGFIFAAAAFIEQKQLASKANISFMRGKKTVNKEGVTQFDLNDAFTVLEGVKNTPKYWQTVKYDMIAKLENIGPFHIFFTLSCGDTICEENFLSFLVENGYSIKYEVDKNGDTKTTVAITKDGREINKPLHHFLQEDVNE